MLPQQQLFWMKSELCPVAVGWHGQKSENTCEISMGNIRSSYSAAHLGIIFLFRIFLRGFSKIFTDLAIFQELCRGSIEVSSLYRFYITVVNLTINQGIDYMWAPR